MFDLNIEVINNNNNLASHNNDNINSNNNKENSDNNKEDENSATNNSELSGTSSASSLVNATTTTTVAADESPISGAGEFDFFSNTAVSPYVTRQLFPMNDVENDVRSSEYCEVEPREIELLRLGSSSSSSRSSSGSNQWLNLSVLGPGPSTGPEESNVKQQVRKSRRGPRSRSSQYRGVTFYRRTGRWESHIWDCGKQVYLGGFDTAHAAARAYDRAAIKFRGVDADINFTIADYDEDMKQMKNLSKEEFVHILRRQSTGFSRGSSRYRGVTLHKCGRWEARMGQFLGKKAYDKAAIQCNGREAVTNFDPSSYDGQIAIMQVNNEGDGQNLDLNLGISITLDGPKRSHDKGVGESQLQHPALHLANGKHSLTYSNDHFHKNKNGSSSYFSSGAPPLYGQPLASRQSPNMWSGLPPGWSAPYEQDKAGDSKPDQAIAASARIPNWTSYMQNQGQGGSNGVGVGGTANQVPLLSTAASSGFSSYSTTTPFSTPYPFANYHTDFHNHGRSR